MAVELKVPEAGESITEVVIGQWLKQEGEWVDKDEVIVEIETDKVTLELPAPEAGVIEQILKQEGDDAEVGEVIGRLNDQAEPNGDAGDRGRATAKPEPQPASEQQRAPADGHVMPAAQRVIAQEGLDASTIEGTGPGGRILKSDAEQAAKSQPKPDEKPAPKPKPERQPDAEAGGQAEDKPGVDGDPGYRATERVKMTPMRRRIAERLVDAQQTAALLTTFNEIDMSEVMALRKSWQEEFTKQHGIRLGFMSFFVKACVDALKRFPAINAQIDGQEIVYHDYYDIGIAVSGPKGLAVPIIRNAERLGFAEVEQAIADFGVRAKDNKLDLSELEGGTFTITNGGIFGSLLSTPIINPPQSGILGMHAIQERPIAVNGEVVIRPMMYVALTYDHRIVDGREAVTFLKRIKEAVENPSRMLIEV